MRNLFIYFYMFIHVIVYGFQKFIELYWWIDVIERINKLLIRK